MTIPLFGFSFMKGVDSLDYPYLEMLDSLTGLCPEIYLAIGESKDKTLEKIQTFAEQKKKENISILHISSTQWSENLVGDGGKVFSVEANKALAELRSNQKQTPIYDKAWAIFLHCDEIIHPNDYEELIKTIERADRENYDAITFRFFHFWNDHYQIAVSKRWHPAEIRAFRLNSKIECYGDAQGFSGSTKTLHSNIPLYHYGHVREKEKHLAKQKEIMRRIRPGHKFNKYWKRERKSFSKTKTNAILVTHPDFMKNRILRLHDEFNLPKAKKVVYIVDKKNNYDSNLLSRIGAEEVHFVEKVSDVPLKHRRDSMVLPQPNLIESVLYDQPRSLKLKSPLASEWCPKWNLLFRLSHKGICTL